MMRQSGLLWVGSFIILSTITTSLASPAPQLPFICKPTRLIFFIIQVRKVDCARRPRSVCCRDYVAPVVDNKAEETPGEVDVGDEKDEESPDKLIQIASNIHEIVVKPNGEPIKAAEPAVDNNTTSVATTEATTTTTTTTTTTEQNIPPFCLKLKFNCKIFAFHKCCKYNLPSSSSASTLVKVTKEKVVTSQPPLEVTTETNQAEELQPVQEEKKSSILIKKNKPSFITDKKKSLEKKIVKEAKISPVVEKKAKDSPSSFKYSNQNKSKFFSSRKKNSESSLFPAKRKRTGLCKIINCSRSKNHYCCKQELTTTTETTVTTVTPTPQQRDAVEEQQDEDVPVTEIRKVANTTTITPKTTTTTTSTTMKPYGDVTEEETTIESIQLEEADSTVFPGSGDDEESDGAEASSTQDDTTSTSTMMSYPDYTHSDDAEMTTVSATTLDTQTEQPDEEFEEVTMVSKQKSESYEETRIWYDGINEDGEFVEKNEPEQNWSYKDYNGEKVLQVYPVYIPAKTYPGYNEVDNEVFSNSIDDQHEKHKSSDIRNEITCEHVDCLAWPSNKCCSPHVTKKRHSIEEANDKITATIVRIVKSVRWV